jgi:Zn-dependent M28 family amino/carboxypeptidase
MAVDGMRALIILALVLQAPAEARFDSARAWDHLTKLVAIGPRPAGSPAIEKARTYIRTQLGSVGVSAIDQAWDDKTPVGPIHMVNLVATIPGASKNRIIIAGHYDTKRFREFSFVGANDGGSSAAFLMELARVLKARQNALTIELLFLDGEEAVLEWAGNDNTYGSRHYVEQAKRNRSLSTIKAMILVDMIADRDLRIKKDTNSTIWLTNLVWDAARRVGHAAYFPGESTQVEDDHLPFLQAGVPAVDIIDLEYPAWHTPADTLDAVSARSMQIVGDVVMAAIPALETRFK